MKTISLARLYAITMILGLCLSFTGCGSLGASKPAPQAVAYFALYDTAQLVDGAMRTYAIACVRGKVSAKDQQDIDSAHEKFRLSFREAVKLARYDWKTATPEAVGKLATDVLTLIAAVTN